MLAAVFDQFSQVPEVRSVPDPVPGPDCVVLQVEANGICRSDWHAWVGHDATIQLPHVPGHEMAGVVCEVGKQIQRFQVGDRVTVPFACGCGTCRYCQQGKLHLCDAEFQPGFTHWGSFAEYVEIRYADQNLVRLPEELDFVTAASLGCRFATAYRAVVHQGAGGAGEWIAIHGCGGLGASALLIARALGMRTIAVDIDPQKLAWAQKLGAEYVLNGTQGDVAKAIRELTSGGADLSLDAFGSKTTAWNSIRSLRKQGRHVQAGLLLGDDANPPLPTGRIISCELQILGSHGMSATDYPEMLEMVAKGRLDPRTLVHDTIPLSKSPQVLATMEKSPSLGITVITDFRS